MAVPPRRIFAAIVMGNGAKNVLLCVGDAQFVTMKVISLGGGPMRSLCLVMFINSLIVLGCGARDSSPDQSQMEPAPPVPVLQASVPLPQAAVPSLTFDVRNFVRTGGWLAARVRSLTEEYYQADDAIRENGLNDDKMRKYKKSLSIFKADLDSLIGKPVSWPATIFAIDEGGVFFTLSFHEAVVPPSGCGPRPIPTLSGAAYVDHSGIESSNPVRNPTGLILDAEIDRSLAKTLRRDDTIIISGKVSEISLSNEGRDGGAPPDRITFMLSGGKGNK
jgi:hypothetical protein